MRSSARGIGLDRGAEGESRNSSRSCERSAAGRIELDMTDKEYRARSDWELGKIQPRQ